MIFVTHAPAPWCWLPLARPRAARPGPAALTHRFTMQLRRGTSEVVVGPDPGVTVRCRRGRLWITHDGDPKDVVLEADQSYTAQRCERMTLHAVEECEMEMAFRRL